MFVLRSWFHLVCALVVLALVGGCARRDDSAEWLPPRPVSVGPRREYRFVAPRGVRNPDPERPVVKSCLHVAPGHTVASDLSVTRDVDRAAVEIRARFVTGVPGPGDTLAPPRPVLWQSGDVRLSLGASDTGEGWLCFEPEEIPLPHSLEAVVVTATDTLTIDGVGWGTRAHRTDEAPHLDGAGAQLPGRDSATSSPSVSRFAQHSTTGSVAEPCKPSGVVRASTGQARAAAPTRRSAHAATATAATSATTAPANTPPSCAQ